MLPELVHPQEDAGFDSAEGGFQALGDLGVGQPLEERQLDAAALLRRQALEGGADLELSLGALQPLGADRRDRRVPLPAGQLLAAPGRIPAAEPVEDPSVARIRPGCARAAAE